MSATTADVMEGPGGIEGLERLKIPQSSFTLNRRARPPPIDIPTVIQSSYPSSQTQNLQRQQSKGGIRSIFNRHKTERNPTTTVPEEVTVQPRISGNNTAISRTASIPQSATTAPATPAKSMSKPSRINLRGRSVKDGKTAGKENPKLNLKTSPPRPTRSSTTWDPPPLFQAYPQAIKHAQLSASSLSADSILRRTHKRNNSLTEYNPTATAEEKEQAAAKKTEKAKSKHRRQISDTISKAEWTQKIFVLVTSGYLLQYAGDGSFDRLPEKMMQLGKDSVAFASDVIPGKHWVLQISQSMDADGTPTSDSRSLLSRLTFRGGADYRRTATSLLLVLDSAEEMESWLSVMRREIESLGGKKYVPDIVRQKSNHSVPQLEKRPSHRYLIQRDPEQFNSAPLVVPDLENRSWAQLSPTPEDTAVHIPIVDWTKPTVGTSIGHQSATNSFVSHDGQQLDDLRSSNRFSYMSSGQPTLASVQFSSPEPSPTRESSVSTFETTTPKMSIEEIRPRPNASAINERRRSMQVIPISALESQQNHKRHSTYGTSMTPNFSVPNSSSRRFSVTKTQIFSNQSLTSIRSEPVLKSTRKTPPPAISIARPLSPVVDDPSPRQDIEQIKAPEKVSNALQQITASVIDIAPRSPLPSPSPIESTHRAQEPSAPPATRNSLFIPTTNTKSMQQSDLPVPRRPTSMITLNRADGRVTQPSPGTLELKDRDSGARDLIMTKRQSIDLPPRHPLHKLPQKSNSLNQSQAAQQAPVAANTKTKVLRRPSSMQIQPSSYNATSTKMAMGLAFIRQTQTPSHITHSANASVDTPANQVDTIAYPKSTELESKVSSGIQRLKLEDKKGLSNRRSMPFLVGGPPPAPPPNCALPPLPPIANAGGPKKVAVK